MPAIRRDFSGTLEDFVYWDASFAIAFALKVDGIFVYTCLPLP